MLVWFILCYNFVVTDGIAKIKQFNMENVTFLCVSLGLFSVIVKVTFL